MLGKYTNLIIFLTAGAITLVTVVGVTFVFPPRGNGKSDLRIGTYAEVETSPPRTTVYIPPRYEIVPDPEPPNPPDPDYVPREYDEPPSIAKECRPVYPDRARKRGVEGDVVLLVFIDERGEVKNVLVHSSPGLKSMEREAISAAYKCKFNPALKDGEPVGLWYSLVMQFRL